MELPLLKEEGRMLLINVNKKELDEYLEFTNSFIIGLENYSINYYEVSIKEIEEILNKYKNIDLFISINKNIFNKDIKDLETKLISLSKLKIKGILFYDLSILEIVKRLNLNIDLVIHQTHLITNYNICNYYQDKGCKYAYLSTEITKDEIEEIEAKTNIKLMVYFLGHPIISHSKRKLVSNYYLYNEKEDTRDIHIIKEHGKDDKKYYLKETNKGTNILTYDILNGTKAFIELKNKIEYAILDNNLIDDKLFLEILELYKLNLDNKLCDKDLINKMNNLIGTNDGFFYLKTTYKVK